MALLEVVYTPPADTPPLLAGLLVAMHERHFDMLNLVSGLPAGALSWQAGPEMSCLAGLAEHIVEVEGFAGRVAAGEDLRWDGRNGPPPHDSADPATLATAIVDADRFLKGVLTGITGDTLSRPQPGEDRTIGAALVEEFDHAAMHYGQMQLTRHLWEAAHPNFESTYDHWR
ncbi:MAG: DinB family protein [Chloroflexi bacterium]|nr:DinB family protein [Chloroflexota bacterium]